MTLETIHFIQGDSYPEPNLTLKDRSTGDPSDPDTWDPIALDDGGVTVRIDFYRPGDPAVFASVACTKIAGGVNGQVFFRVPAALADQPGVYEGRVVIDRNGDTETLQDKLKIKVKQR